MSEETPNVADEFSELCDGLRDKYGMPDGDWKALLDKGMALYARIPEGALSFEGVQVVTNESALTAVDVLSPGITALMKYSPDAEQPIYIVGGGKTAVDALVALCG